MMQDGLRLLEETLELPPHRLTGTEKLTDVPNWDSLSTLSFIAAVDNRYGVPLQGQLVAQCQTVAELISLFTAACKKTAA